MAGIHEIPAVTKLNPPLPLGYSPLAPGQIANLVTCLEMRRAPDPLPNQTLAPPFRLERFAGADLNAYRSVFQRVGESWLWHSRLTMPDSQLIGILNDPLVESFVLFDAGRQAGILELDFRTAAECELAFIGLTPECIGKAVGQSMMANAIARAWAKPITRFWLHTCSSDHPKALSFYMRSGFKPYAFQVEVQVDPRTTGHLPRHAAPHVPFLEPT